MANICDDIVSNILSRLPGKALLRFRSASKHWNELISDPNFMKSRSRRMILLTVLWPILVIDDNAPVKDKIHSMVEFHAPLERDGLVTVVGTFNGNVLLVLTDIRTFLRCWLIVYNPLTRASKTVLEMDIPRVCGHLKAFVFGFGDDSKIVRFDVSNSFLYTWDVFDLKTSSWSGQPRRIIGDFEFWGDACVFLNGFLYWKIHSPSIDDGIFGILALNVKEMVLSRTKIPFRFKRFGDLLGSVDGCLCMLTTFNATTFDLWVQKEQGIEISWLKVRSLTVRFEPSKVDDWRPVCILGNGKILFTTSEMRLVVYDTSKDSYGTFYHFKTSDGIYPTYSEVFLNCLSSIEYVESLVSPLDFCFN